MLTPYLKTLTRTECQEYVKQRFALDPDAVLMPEEQSVTFADRIHLYSTTDSTASYVLIGIPEDIGVRANLGRPGAAGAWQEFLQVFLGQQHHQLCRADRYSLWGNVVVEDLMQQGEQLDARIHEQRLQLSKLTEQLDERVYTVAKLVRDTGKIPVFIGGGHNNCLPLLRAFGEDHAIDCINIDAHTDLRTAVGRHSGNGFSHALKNGWLNRYGTMGINPAYLTQAMLELISTHSNIEYRNYHHSQDKSKQDFQELLSNLDVEHLALEVDLDVVAHFPSSAQSPVGYTLCQVSRMIDGVITLSRKRTKYLHLCEAAPQYGYTNQVGKSLSYLVNQLR
ncbi:MAG: arginase family protein [Nonlabens sp.]